MEIATIKRGESFTFKVVLNAEYDMARLKEYYLYIGGRAMTGTVNGNAITVKLRSEDTDLMSGINKITLWLDDTILGVQKPYLGDMVVSMTNAYESNSSVSEVDNALIPVTITATAITVGDILYNYVVGRSAYQVWLDEGNTGTVEDYLADIKGDPFTYDDFTPEQLESLKVKGDPFEYSDFTSEQIALLQKPASDIATTVSSAEQLRATAETNRNNAEGLRLSAEVTRNENEADRIEAEGLRAGAETGRQTAEGLRVQAELNRQSDTATAILNAEQATDDANDAAILANEKAGLANEKALLANEKAGLAATATTQANDARDGANMAAQTANEAATNISPAVINNEQVQAEIYNVLNARIAALESLIANGIFSYLQADTLIGVNSMLYKGAEIFIYGTAAPNFAPNFIGQFYINTTAGTTYQAKGIGSAADWKQTSN